MIKRILLGLFASVVLAVSASAETIKLKFNDLAELGASLKALDGAEKSIKTEQGDRILRVPFDLKATTRIAIAKDLSSVRLALDSFEAQRQRLLVQVSPGAPEKVSSDMRLLTAFATQWNDYVSKNEVPIEVVFLTEDGLNLDVNKEITGTILAGLSPVLRSK